MSARYDSHRGGAGPEEERGMGWGGLVPTAAERRQERAEQQQRDQVRRLQAERDAYKWAYEYLRDRPVAPPGNWAQDCDSEIEARIAQAVKS